MGYRKLNWQTRRGIGRAHLSQIENGTVAARIDTLYAIAPALDLKLEELLKGF